MFDMMMLADRATARKAGYRTCLPPLRHCGHWRQAVPRPGQDLTGQRFGRLVAVERQAVAGKPTRWLCECDCGGQTLPTSSQLLGGRCRSCGCLKAETNKARLETHGKRHSRVYGTWNGMIQRCTNPNQSHYERYGGRGVTVCDAWKTFANFYADMGDP
ncbi:MAG: hypothetical protein K0S28_1856, partial [Paucimonas sp.]|nr:hypothetical protein [Paucimonas sp.]